MAEGQRVVAVCVGALDEALRELLRDVFREAGLDLRFAPLWERSPDLVLAAPEGRDAGLALEAARETAGSRPILVLLPFTDERLERLARAAGVFACWALDTPLGGLVSALRRLAGTPSAVPAWPGR